MSEKKRYTEEELKQWRKDSDNFIGSDKDRDKLFKELRKFEDAKGDKSE